MSGGHWDYCQHMIRYNLEGISEDPEVKERFPLLAKKLSKLATILDSIIHDLDWDLSGDSEIENDMDFELESLGKL